MTTITVKLIWMNEHAALIETARSEGEPPNTVYRRVIVPADALTGANNQCSEEVIAEGIVSGMAWEDKIPALAFKTVVANELRRRGLWSRADLLARPEEVKSAFIAAAMSGYGLFLQNVTEESK